MGGAGAGLPKHANAAEASRVTSMHNRPCALRPSESELSETTERAAGNRGFQVGSETNGSANVNTGVSVLHFFSGDLHPAAINSIGPLIALTSMIP